MSFLLQNECGVLGVRLRFECKVVCAGSIQAKGVGVIDGVAFPAGVGMEGARAFLCRLRDTRSCEFFSRCWEPFHVRMLAFRLEMLGRRVLQTCPVLLLGSVPVC